MQNYTKDIEDFNLWFSSIKARLAEFVELMKHPKSTGGYYYSPNGDRFSFPILCSTVFATKVLYMLNDDINDKDKISSFLLRYLNDEYLNL